MSTEEGRGSRVAGRGYQQLRAWQKAHAMALCAFRISEALRQQHRWLASQLVRSAVSVAANIAEGYNRGSIREYLHFLSIARGSLAETEYYILFSIDAGLLTSEAGRDIRAFADDTGNLLLGLIRSLQAKDGGGGTRVIREEPLSYSDDLSDEQYPHVATRDPSPATRPEAS